MPFGPPDPFGPIITKIERAINPETGEPLETFGEFKARQRSIVNDRLNGKAAQKDLAQCAEAAGEAAAKISKPLKAVGEIVNLFDVIKLGVEDLTTDREVTLLDYLEAYLGYHVEFVDPSRQEI